MPITPGPWAMAKCPCSRPSCDQWTISTQGSVGFSKTDARAIVEVPAMAAILHDVITAHDSPDSPASDLLWELAIRDARAALARIDKED